ncbi:MAG: choice-of-anchor D domain-containing protein, partial [Candidatus Kapaibacterium sp.]
IIDLESKPKFNLAVDALDKNFRIDANSTVEKTITVNNPSSKAVDVLISRNESIALPNGWSVELVENQKNVPAGATVEFKVNVTSGSTAGLAEISFNALPINIGEDFPMTKSVRFLALSNKTKYAIFVGAHGQISAIVNAVNGLQKYASETALIPINAEILNTFSPKDFEVSIVSNNFDLYGLFGGRFNESGIIMNQILEAINSGKKVIMASDYDLTFANSQQGSQQARDFYKSIGVESAAQAVNRRQIVNNQWGGTLYNFDIKGIQNDPISNGMAFIGNQYNQTTNPFYVYWTDFIRPTSGSDGVQFLNLDNDVSKGGGLRFQKGNSRYVYLSVGFEALNPNDRRLLVERILDWVTEPTTNPGGPSISLNTNALNFGTVDTDKNKELDVVITNSGDENLNISEIAITGDDNGYFSIVSGADVTSITPGNSSTIKVRFAPTSGGNFTAALNVMSNGANEQSSTVNLSGIGNPAGSVAYGTTPNGMLSMSMTPNPVSANSRFNYTITGNGAKNVRIYVMDLAGRKVQELVNNSVEVGNHSIEFSANGFSAGTYYIMAEIDGSQAQIPVVIVK